MEPSDRDINETVASSCELHSLIAYSQIKKKKETNTYVAALHNRIESTATNTQVIKSEKGTWRTGLWEGRIGQDVKFGVFFNDILIDL